MCPFSLGRSREFIEICEDTERQFRRSDIASELQRGVGIVVDIHCGFFRLYEEFPFSADTEGIIVACCCFVLLNHSLVDDFAVGLRISLFDIYIPA